MDGKRKVKNYGNKVRLPFTLLMAMWSFILFMSVHAKCKNKKKRFGDASKTKHNTGR